MSLLYKIDKAILVDNEEVQIVLPYTTNIKINDVLLLRKNNLEEIMSIVRSIEQYEKYKTTIAYVGINPDLLEDVNLNEDLVNYKVAEYFGSITYIKENNGF